jgi:hypothetical protein
MITTPGEYPMKPRRFQPTAVDALEDRLVMTAFPVPFTVVMPPASEINPKFLNLTGRTESQINSAISSAFNRFSHSYLSALNAFDNGKTSSDQFVASATEAFNRLSSDLLSVSKKVPFGGLNLNPVLQNRIVGSEGVTDTTTNVNRPSLQTKLTALLGTGTASDAQAAINSSQSFVRGDVNNYINLGVTNNFFRLTRGASLPRLS